MEDKKHPETSPETGLIDIKGYVHQVKKEDTGSQIRVSKGGYIILRVYKEQKRKPVVTVLHCMIGQAAPNNDASSYLVTPASMASGAGGR